MASLESVDPPIAPARRLSGRTLALLIALTAFYIIVGYAVQGGGAKSGEWLDPDRISWIGLNLCRHGEFAVNAGTPSLSRAPAYPAALAIPCLISGYDPVRFAPLVNGVCQFVTLLALSLHSLVPRGRARALVLTIVGLDPLLINYGGRTYLEPMLIMSVALVIVAIDRLIRTPDLRSTLLLGAAWGGSLLVKPILLVFVVVLVPGLLLIKRAAAVRSVAAFGVALLMILPWTVRNHRITGGLIPVTTGAWEIVLKGDTFSRYLFERDGIESLEAQAKQRLSSLDGELGIRELPLQEREPYYAAYALRILREQPGSFIYKLVVQSLSFWFLGGDPAKTLLFIALQLPLIVMVILSCASRRLDPMGDLAGFGLCTLYLVAVHSATLAIARYSMPLRPWIVLIAASGVVRGFLSLSANQGIPEGTRRRSDVSDGRPGIAE